ncbi:MAG: hypothetical protein IJF71_04775 [Clostridia bacterium]|nr:hypothetical protein [Clostridia bacterium]
MGFFDLFKRKKCIKVDASITDESFAMQQTPEDGASILLEQLPITYGLDKAKLLEVTDSGVLARIDSLIPTVGSMGASVGNIVHCIKNQQDGTIYRVILKKGGQLVDSKTMPGAKRAFSIGEKGIKENANLIEVDTKGGVIANAAVGVMALASMVVGQYYMHQVSTQLTDISNCISRITEFLDAQYSSQVAFLLESVYSISKFQLSSIENEELRGRELDHIQMLRSKCQELLNQAETMLNTEISKHRNSFDGYEKAVKEIGRWLQYQSILIRLLYQIGILDCTLHLGVKPKEQCFSSFTLHTKKEETIHKDIAEWHQKQCESLKIDLEESRRKNTGLLGLFEKPISWVHDAWNYRPIDECMVEMIRGQAAECEALAYAEDNLFNEDVQIICLDGKYFYLPSVRDR